MNYRGDLRQCALFRSARLTREYEGAAWTKKRFDATAERTGVLENMTVPAFMAHQ